MYAFKGDHVRVEDEHGCGTRAAVVISGHYSDGRPPYWVRWSDTGEEDVLYPSPDAYIDHAGPAYPLEDEPRLVVAAVVV
jgi:hypothetical protein